MNTRPVGILRYNAEKMRDNGAPASVISQYLADNGSSIEQIAAVPTPNPQELERMLASEKDGSFAKLRQDAIEATAQADKSRRNMERLATAQGIARGFGNGLLWGFADEIESGLTGQDINQIRAEQQKFAEDHPVMNIGATVVGAIANPTGAIGGAARGGVPLRFGRAPVGGAKRSGVRRLHRRGGATNQGAARQPRHHPFGRRTE